ncbi:MAG: hypothetical protein DI606_10135 [Sphingobium sp.]|uniref:hypothetical protein n=1 Tax=Alphaproteobacteria TaxID=28211 RepID=UPI000DB30A56|nr:MULTISPECIES: hypothetical protein [Alphaproteobacteria]PZU12183.1 MAG: hypothetical protein DI606_10135 [Sphingobium sp.]TAJ29409.1 MAG: hypothetical protein EPO59_15250 [Bosea sp. (in: a-proteobacteria)]
MKVFWSWQSDRAAKYNREVIEDALGRALAALSNELELDPSEGPQLDHDTKDAKGMAAIADTIFEKIRTSALFVGDITTAGKSDGGRELPNPNVLIELGWAWAHLSHENIILVANKYYGPKKAENLPFDIRHRRAVIFFTLAKTADADAIEAATLELAKAFQEAIRTSLGEWLASIASAPGPAGMPSREGDPSIWFEKDAVLQHQPYHGGGGIERVQLAESRRLYARIVPEKFKSGIPKALRVHSFQGHHGQSGLDPMGPWTSADGGLNGEGVLRYAPSQRGEPTTTWTATQWFRETGELWSFDTARLSKERFYIGTLVEEVVSFLARGLEMLYALGASGQIRIEIGAVGLLGTQWPGQFQHERSDALIDRVRVSQSRRKWDEAAIDELMLEVTNEMADAFGRPHFQVEQIRTMIARQ